MGRPLNLLLGLAFALGIAVVVYQIRTPKPPKHGIEFQVELDRGDANAQEAVRETTRVLGKRLERFGARFSIRSEGGEWVWVRMGIPTNQVPTALRLIQKPGVLEFALVHPENRELARDDIPVPGYRKITRQGSIPPEVVLIKKTAELRGGIASAMAERGNSGQADIFFTLDADATARFAEITRANVGQQLAIILDGELMTAPLIRDPIEKGSGQISGAFNLAEAVGLAAVLQNPLPYPVRVTNQKPF